MLEISSPLQKLGSRILRHAQAAAQGFTVRRRGRSTSPCLTNYVPTSETKHFHGIVLFKAVCIGLKTFHADSGPIAHTAGAHQQLKDGCSVQLSATPSLDQATLPMTPILHVLRSHQSMHFQTYVLETEPPERSPSSRAKRALRCRRRYLQSPIGGQGEAEKGNEKEEVQWPAACGESTLFWHSRSRGCVALITCVRIFSDLGFVTSNSSTQGGSWHGALGTLPWWL